MKDLLSFLGFKAEDAKENTNKKLVLFIDFLYVISLLGFILRSSYLNHKSQKLRVYVYLISTFYGLLSISIFLYMIMNLIGGYRIG